MSVATLSEDPTIKELAFEKGENSLERELSKKDKQKVKKEREKREKEEKKERDRKEKERKEKERKEKKEKKDRKFSKDELEDSKSDPTSPTESEEIASPLEPDTPFTSEPSSTHPSNATSPASTIGETILPQLRNIQITEDHDPSLPKAQAPEPDSLESAIIDATQTKINETEQPPPPATDSEQSILNKQNWTKTIGSVRNFLVTTSATVVDKINQKLDELDEQFMEQYSDSDFDTDGHRTPRQSSIDGVVFSPAEQEAITRQQRYQQQRQELLGQKGDAPPPVPPKDAPFSDANQAHLSTHAALAETADALNERNQKLQQLGDKMEDLNDNSSEFARIARELAQREANRKWYHIF